jgi:hypothetical protein
VTLRPRFTLAVIALALSVAASVASAQVPADLRAFAVGRSVLERYLGRDSVAVVVQGPVQVYATRDWQPDAEAAARAAERVLPAVLGPLGLPAALPAPVWILVAPGGGALEREAPEWTAGIARPGERLIVLSGPALRSRRAALDATIAHELAHLLLHQRIGEFGWVPQWFDEGLAVQLSGAVGWRDRLATWGRGPVHLRDLTDAFPREARAARFAYVESAAALQRLLERGSLSPLLDRVAAGEDFDVAFATIYGESADAFAERIHGEVGRRRRFLAALGGGVTLGGTMALLAVVAVLRTRRRDRRRAREWAAAESLQPIPTDASPGFDSPHGDRP